MDFSLPELLRGLSNPVTLFGHFTYALLIISMLMRSMVWLRVLAVVSGSCKVIYRAFFLVDPVSVFWEAIFTIVNIIQLILIWYYQYRHRFDAEEKHFAEQMPRGIDRSSIRRFLALGTVTALDPDMEMTRQGQAVADLTYIAEGIVKVEADGKLLAICGPGDWIGELSFLSGREATATATVVKPTRVIRFNQQRLHTAIARDAALRRTLETALNRNLAGKLTRSNAMGAMPG
ncbi:Popeye protein conserved region [Devosia enhydra]|uniref:Popeye protein conserved region n=1 Tax=Devosia enhydra TaxID=665118 RepID=A0A1K2HTT1_9HYPH|nr:cyclic nucleotide-binding domain-containing protein [Devosia enhydra]SFZ81726.1 Popeye protein conserved region [Devosia enhydra]